MATARNADSTLARTRKRPSVGSSRYPLDDSPVSSLNTSTLVLVLMLRECSEFHATFSLFDSTQFGEIHRPRMTPRDSRAERRGDIVRESITGVGAATP